MIIVKKNLIWLIFKLGVAFVSVYKFMAPVSVVLSLQFVAFLLSTWSILSDSFLVLCDRMCFFLILIYLNPY